MVVYVIMDGITGKIIGINAGPKGLRRKRRSKRENPSLTGNAELPVDQPQNPYGLPQYICDRLPSQRVIIGGCVVAVSAGVIVVLYRLDKTIQKLAHQASDCIGELKEQMITSSENFNRLIAESAQQVVDISEKVSQVCDKVEKMEKSTQSLVSKLFCLIYDHVLKPIGKRIGEGFVNGSSIYLFNLLRNLIPLKLT